MPVLYSLQFMMKMTIFPSVLMIAIFLMTLLGGNQPKNWVGNPGSVRCSQNPPPCEKTSDALLILDILLFSFLQDLLWIKFIAGPGDASAMLNPLVFRYAIGGLGSVITYSMMVGLVLCVLIGLNATKIITEKRLEFYREAQSNANTTAYYVAATVTTTIEQGFSAFVGSVLAYLILNPSASFVVSSRLKLTSFDCPIADVEILANPLTFRYTFGTFSCSVGSLFLGLSSYPLSFLQNLFQPLSASSWHSLAFYFAVRYVF
mmetsp:Transcript_828/g.1815  ORF Transcript_828/g.1815 Transcript_828/m.1815 type:complete len:261 (+) Transcript_828:92-874(+)